MGHVVANGLELLGTCHNASLDGTLRSNMEQMLSLAQNSSGITAREKKHVRALELWGKGYVVYFFSSEAYLIVLFDSCENT